MSHAVNERIAEQAQQMFDEDPLDCMVTDEQSQSRLLWFMECNMPKELFQEYVTKWLATKDGQHFMDNAVSRIIERITE